MSRAIGYLTPLSVLAIIFAIKGLGGSFNSLFDQLGLSLAHGPMVGAGIFAFLLACVWSARKSVPSPPAQPFLTKNSIRMFGLVWMVLVSGAVFLRVQAMQQFPLDAARADMLPTVLSQVQDFLAGRSPYGESLLPGAHTVVRCYWPALWGPFIPFFMLGVDIRFLNLLAQLVFYVLITECYLRRKVVFGWGWRLDSTVFFLVLSLHLFSKQAIRDVYDVQTGALWLFYALFLWSILRERPGLTDVVIPFLILSRQPAFLLVVPYWIWLGKREGRRLRKSLLITLVLALAISLPFLILDANGFFRGIFFYSSVAAQTPAEVTLAWHGLLGVLKITGLDSLALPLQVGGLALGIYWAMKNENKDPIFVLGLGALVYAWFMLFVAVTFKYLFIEPVMVLYFLAFAAGLPRQQTNSGYSP